MKYCLHARKNAFSTKYSQIFSTRGVPCGVGYMVLPTIYVAKHYTIRDIIIHFCLMIETQYIIYKRVVMIFYLRRVPHALSHDTPEAPIIGHSRKLVQQDA